MNIFVAKLSAETTGEKLRRLFEPYGEVTSAKVIFDKTTGNSKRFGFVEMPNDNEGYAAIEALDGSSVDNSTVVVKKSESRPEKPSGRSNSNNRKRY